MPPVKGEHQARLRHAVAVDQVVASAELLEGREAVVGVGIDGGLQRSVRAEAIVGRE